MKRADRIDEGVRELQKFGILLEGEGIAIGIPIGLFGIEIAKSNVAFAGLGVEIQDKAHLAGGGDDPDVFPFQ